MWEVDKGTEDGVNKVLTHVGNGDEAGRAGGATRLSRGSDRAGSLLGRLGVLLGHYTCVSESPDRNRARGRRMGTGFA